MVRWREEMAWAGPARTALLTQNRLRGFSGLGLADWGSTPDAVSARRERKREGGAVGGRSGMLLPLGVHAVCRSWCRALRFRASRGLLVVAQRRRQQDLRNEPRKR